MEPKEESTEAPATPRSDLSGREDAREDAARNARGNAGKDDESQAPSCSPWAMYRRAIKERPVATKAITAAAVSALGELLGTAIKAHFVQPTSRSPAMTRTRGGASRELIQGGSVAVAGSGAGAGPSLLRRTASFAIFGLVLNGPVFHWWYNMLERASERLRKPGEAAGGTRDIAFKLAMDRFVATPPYLLMTLLALRLMQGLGIDRSVRETRQLYLGALIKNYKVWTLAQLINFKLIPIEFRPLFGNLVSVWWNVYLSLLSTEK
ncbi:unnamed protein product [Ascophyllum nodosum]